MDRFFKMLKVKEALDLPGLYHTMSNITEDRVSLFDKMWFSCANFIWSFKEPPPKFISWAFYFKSSQDSVCTESCSLFSRSLVSEERVFILNTNSVSVFFRTALMLACETGSSNIVEALIKKGADLNLVDSLGHNALHYSKLSENAGIQSLLLSKISQDAGMWKK